MTARAIFFSQLRGACPGLSAPMPTGDGLLVRLLPIGTISLDAFTVLGAAARAHGNGVIEITARGSIQIRGLSAASAPRFADAVAELKIAAGDGVPVLSNPLAGLDPEEILDAARLAADLRSALAGTSVAANLAPKVSVAIDGGGALGLDGLAADVRLAAQGTRDGTVIRASVGGDGTSATELGAVAPSDCIEAALRLLDVLARSGRSARARDIVAADGAAAFRKALADLLLRCEPLRKPHVANDIIGAHRLRDGTIACGIALAFGHADAAAFERLAEAGRSHGAVGVRAVPGRALMMIGLRPEAASSFLGAAENLGFIIRGGDPRRHVIACAGAPICSSAHIPTRAMAPGIAETVAPHLGAGSEIHLSGCGKGCARAKAAALTIVGTASGCALIADGTVRDRPFTTVPADQLRAAIRQYIDDRANGSRHV